MTDDKDDYTVGNKKIVWKASGLEIQTNPEPCIIHYHGEGIPQGEFRAVLGSMKDGWVTYKKVKDDSKDRSDK